MKKILGILAVIVIIVLLILFGKGFGFGFGSGNGDGDGDGSGQEVTESVVDETDSQQNESEDVKSSTLSELPDRITITIKEDKVFLEDIPIENAEALREYLEEINTDSKEYVLNDENSILGTYEWVVGVFEELNIPLKE